MAFELGIDVGSSDPDCVEEAPDAEELDNNGADKETEAGITDEEDVPTAPDAEETASGADVCVPALEEYAVDVAAAIEADETTGGCDCVNEESVVDEVDVD